MDAGSTDSCIHENSPAENSLIDPISKLSTHASLGALVAPLDGGGWRLSVPPGSKGHYRLAQLDDYAGRPRRCFSWRPDLTINLEARVSASNIPGTWGFGLWNDPFTISLGFGGGTRRFPALPNAAWFFFASPSNYLSFRDDLPARGFLAQTFRSPSIPAPLLALGALGIPLLVWPWMAGKLRPLISRLINEGSFELPCDAIRWHTYSLDWNSDHVTFGMDGEYIFQTSIVPNAPLGLVIWMDNQFAAFPPGGGLSFGMLPSTEPAWIEIKSLEICN